MTPFALLLCVVAALVSAATIAIALARLRWRGVRIGLASLLGLAMAVWVAPVAIGIDEGTWAWTTGSLWISAVLGLAGFWLVGVALHRALTQPRRAPGQCTTCGYELHGLARCPECGGAVPEGPRRS